MATATRPAQCPDCGKLHSIDYDTYFLFGYDCHCDNCVADAHVTFMHKQAENGPVTCVASCRCGYGS